MRTVKLKFEDVLPYWPTLLLAGFASASIPLVTLLGYRWSIELVLAIFLLATVFLTSRTAASSKQLGLMSAEFKWIILPIALFVIWSFASMSWAKSWRGALHHTLLWACYLLFYFVIRRSLDEERIVQTLRVAGGILLIISLACVVEHFAGETAGRRVFNERYYSYAEIIVAFLPILLAYGLTADRNWGWGAIAVSTICWAAVLATSARTMLIAGVSGLIGFAFLLAFKLKDLVHYRRVVVSVACVVLVGLGFVALQTSRQHISVVERLSGNEEHSVRSADSRYLLWGLAIEGFRARPLTGIGGDNYFWEYKSLRESLSTRNSDSTVIELNEDIIPERAHNEFLQIAAELGILGALIFGWFLAGIGYIGFEAIRRGASLLTMGALAGMIAFLVASMASSYSFRFPTNGICFLFLLAIAAKEIFAEELREDDVVIPRQVLLVVGVTVCVAMIVFCLGRVNSIRHLTNAMQSQDDDSRAIEIEKAIAADPSEPMFRYYYGQWLQKSGDHDAAAIEQMRLSIDNGFADSVAFFRLVEAELAAGRSATEIEETYRDALRVYPRSVFLRTAFAAYLKTIGEHARAREQTAMALSVDERQARSWQLAHDEGLERLVQVSRDDERFVSTFDLRPESGALALVNFQRKTRGRLP